MTFWKELFNYAEKLTAPAPPLTGEPGSVEWINDDTVVVGMACGHLTVFHPSALQRQEGIYPPVVKMTSREPLRFDHPPQCGVCLAADESWWDRS